MSEPVRVRLEGLEGVLNTLKRLPPEIVSKRGGPVRAALRKAALVIRNEVLVQLEQVIADGSDADASAERTSGLLAQNIVITRGKRGQQNGESMIVRVRNKRYPGRTGQGATTAQVARLLEYGREDQPPRPFIRRAFAAKQQQALDTFVTDVNRRIADVVKRLERESGTR